MSSLNDDRFRAAIERAASARAAKTPSRKRGSAMPELMLGMSAAALAFLALAANRPDLANDAIERVAIALMREPSLDIDTQTTASIPKRALTIDLGAQEGLQSASETIGQGNGSARTRIDIDMGEETLRGSL